MGKKEKISYNYRENQNKGEKYEKNIFNYAVGMHGIIL